MGYDYLPTLNSCILNLEHQGFSHECQITKKDFDALEARVKALENDRPPGAMQALADRLTKVEGALDAVSGALKDRVTHDELRKTRRELEETIERASAEIRGLKKLLSQRGQTQSGT